MIMRYERPMCTADCGPFVPPRNDHTKNWAKHMTHGPVWVYTDPAPTNPCQYYIEEG